MAIVTKKGELVITALDADPVTLPKTQFNGGRVRAIHDKAQIANGDSANSTVTLARIPSNARIKASSILHHDGITGLTDFDIGFAADPDALADGVSLASAGSKNVLTSVAIENYHKLAWELAGLTKDPGGFLDIIGTMKTGASAAGDIAWDVEYVVD